MSERAGLAAAKACLLNPELKATYDLSIAPPVQQQPIAIPLVAFPIARPTPMIPAPQPVAQPAHAVPPQTSVATVGYIASQRSKAALYRLGAWSIIAIATVGAAAVAYSIHQQRSASRDLAKLEGRKAAIAPRPPGDAPEMRSPIERSRIQRAMPAPSSNAVPRSRNDADHAELPELADLLASQPKTDTGLQTAPAPAQGDMRTGDIFLPDGVIITRDSLEAPAGQVEQMITAPAGDAYVEHYPSGAMASFSICKDGQLAGDSIVEYENGRPMILGSYLTGQRTAIRHAANCAKSPVDCTFVIFLARAFLASRLPWIS